VIYDELNNIISLYIGETDNVVRRIKGYLKPGPSQMTNIRMKSQFENYIKIGYQIHLEIMKINGFKLNGREYLQESLSDPCIRKLIENLVIIEEKNKGFDLLNAKV
jgi:hypothetical protein